MWDRLHFPTLLPWFAVPDVVSFPRPRQSRNNNEIQKRIVTSSYDAGGAPSLVVLAKVVDLHSLVSHRSGI